MTSPSSMAQQRGVSYPSRLLWCLFLAFIPITYQCVRPLNADGRCPPDNTEPTAAPSRRPTAYPTVNPSWFPSIAPSRRPSNNPSARPSYFPTATPTRRPTNWPTLAPTGPTFSPTAIPTDPTVSPTYRPTAFPTTRPTFRPSLSPSYRPTISPSISLAPSLASTRRPVVASTRRPTFIPTSPTCYPSTAVVTSLSIMASQNLTGIGTKTFLASSNYTQAFRSAVSGSLTGIRPDQVTNIAVRTVGRPSSARHLRDLSTPGASSVEISYAIGFIMEELGYTDPDNAFSTIKSQLQSSVEDSTFNQLLQKFGFPADVAASGPKFGSETVVLIRSAEPSIEPTLNPSSSPSSNPSSNSSEAIVLTSSKKSEFNMLPIYIAAAAVGFCLLVVLAGLFFLRCVDYAKRTSKYKSVEGTEPEAIHGESRTDGSAAGIVDWLLPDPTTAAEDPLVASDAKKRTGMMTFISEMTLFPSASKMRDKLPDNKEDISTVEEVKTDDQGTEGAAAGVSDWLFPDPVTAADEAQSGPESTKKASIKNYFSSMVLFRSPSKSSSKQADAKEDGATESVSEPVTIVGTSEAAKWMFPDPAAETENTQSVLDATNAASGVVVPTDASADTGSTTIIIQTVEPTVSEASAVSSIIDVVSSSLAMMVPDAMVGEEDNEADDAMINGMVPESLQTSTNKAATPSHDQRSSATGSTGVKESNPPVVDSTAVVNADSTAAGSQSGDSSGEFTSVNSIIDAMSSTIAMMVPDAVVGDVDTDEQESGVSGVEAQLTSEVVSDTAVSDETMVGGSTPKKSSKKKNVLKQLLRSSSKKSATTEEEPTTASSDFVPAMQKDGTAAQTPLQATDTSTGGDGGTTEKSTSIIDVVSSTIAMMVPDSMVSTAEELRNDEEISPGGGPASTDASSSKKSIKLALFNSSSKGDHPPEVPSVSKNSPDRAASSGNISLASWLFPNASTEQDEKSEIDSAAEREKSKSPSQRGLFRSASKRGNSPDPSPATQSDIRRDEATAAPTSSVLDALSNTIAMIIPDAALGHDDPVVEEAVIEPAKKPFIRRQLQSMFRRDSTESVPLPPSGPSTAVEQVGVRGSSSSSSVVIAQPPPPLQTNGSITRKAATTTFQKPKSMNKNIKFTDASTK